MHLSTIAPDGKRLGFLLNPRGGAWGGALQTMPGLTAGGVFLILPSTGSVCCDTMGALAGSYVCDADFPSEGIGVLRNIMASQGKRVTIDLVQKRVSEHFDLRKH